MTEKKAEEKDTRQEVRYLTKKEAAEMLRCSIITIDRYMKNGELPYHKLGKKVLFDFSDVLAFMQSKRVFTTSDIDLIRDPETGRMYNRNNPPVWITERDGESGENAE